MNTQLLQQASVLDIDEQIELVEAIWDGIVSRGAAPALTDTQKTELDRRLADHLATRAQEPPHHIDGPGHAGVDQPLAAKWPAWCAAGCRAVREIGRAHV